MRLLQFSSKFLIGISIFLGRVLSKMNFSIHPVAGAKNIFCNFEMEISILWINIFRSLK